MEHKNPKKILIIKPSSLGDIVHSLPVLNAIHKNFPDAGIHWIVARGFEEILEGQHMLKKLWIINKDEWKKITRLGPTVLEVNKLTKNLKAERYDCVIDLQGLFRSGFIAKATGAPVRIGFREAREGSALFYTHRIKGGKDIHAVDRYLKIAAYLGCDISDVQFPLPAFDQALTDLPVNGDYAVIAPGARHRTKIWPAERFGEVASLLPLKAVVIGSRGDAAIADDVVRASKGNAVSIAGKTGLKELACVVKNARFMVCNDTGPMHIAAALRVPVFAIFGPTNPVRTGPYGRIHTVIRKDIPCSPCYKKTCATLECLNMIEAGEVAENIRMFLSDNTQKL